MGFKHGEVSYAEWSTVPVIEGVLQSLLVGSMLGDGRLVQRVKTLYIENHAEAQRAYLEWKVSLWGGWVKTAPKPVTWKKGGREYLGVRFNTVSHEWLNPWHARFYSKPGPKTLVPEIVDSVDAFALAVWYLDDGGAAWWPDITFGLPPESRAVAESIFEKFSLAPRWFPKKGNTGVFHMEREETALKFLDIIRPHVPPCMQYKLGNFGFQGPQAVVREKLNIEVLRDLAAKGTPIRTIATLLDVGATTVSRHLVKHNIHHPRLLGNPLHREK
jgi:hypothetical protein